MPKKEKMRQLKTAPHLTDKEIKEKLKSQKNTRAFLDWQIILAVQTNPGISADKLAKILNVSKNKIYHTIQNYNKRGENWRTYDNWGGRREARCNLSLEEEKKILEKVEKDALSGKILIYKHVKDIVEEAVGREVSDDYIWDMFKRHNWKKKVPRQSHPKADKEKQKEFKKNSKKVWQPNH